MHSFRNTARYVGSFFIFSNVVFILGAVIFLEPVLGAPDYLQLASASRATVVTGVMLELLNAFAYLGIAVFMFPVLKRRYESLALGYIGFRILEFVMQILAELSPLALLNLSEAFLSAGAPADSYFQTIGAMLIAERHWAFQMISLTLGSGALLFYSMLYQLKLVPRFISMWGLLGAAIVLVNMLGDMLGANLPNLGYVMLLNELTLGVWLIVKGFNKQAEFAMST